MIASLARCFAARSVPTFKSLAALSWLAFAGVIAGCGGDVGVSGPPVPTVVTPATLTSISIAPPDATLVAGLTLQFSATGVYSDGTKTDISSSVTWSAGTPATASISGTGLATAHAAGTTTIKATSGGISCTTNLTVTAPTLVSISVTPAAPSIAKGTTQQFVAMGMYSDNSTQVLTTATWSSSVSAVAAISNAAATYGIATASMVGTTTITATLGNVTSLGVTLTVTPATLVSIAVTPPTPTLAQGNTQHFVATGIYSDNSNQVLTTQVTWTSSAPSVATISNTAGANGVATAAAVGTTSITAALSGVTSPGVTLTVTSATLVSISVTTPNLSVPKGTKPQFTAIGTYSDTSTQVITTQVTWSSSVPSTATISNAAGFDGQATANAVGTTSISASLGGVSSPGVTLTVTAAVITSINVTPAAPTVPNGLTVQFTATALFSDNSTPMVLTTATWASSVPNTATISSAPGSNGLATTAHVGTTSITASYGGVTSTGVTLTVTAAVLQSITVTPGTASIAVGSGAGTTEQFTATGHLSDGTPQTLTTSVTWTSSTGSVASISNAAGTNGLAQGLTVGTTTITATLGSISGTANLTVTAAALQSITITPLTPSIAAGTTQPFTATGHLSNGNTTTITTSVTWTSATPSVATINASGLAQSTTTTTGTTVIQAASGAILSNQVTLTVTAATLVSISVTPSPAPNIRNGTTLQFTATGTFTAGNPQTLTTNVTWTSSVGATASISNAAGTQGLATALAIGTTQIQATQGTVQSPLVPLTVTANTYLYATDIFNGYVLQYTIGTNGGLVPMATAHVPTQFNPAGLAVDVTGHYLYVANSGSASVSQFTIDADGVLAPMTTAVVAAGSGANAVTIDPSGPYAYVPNSIDGTVSQYSIGGDGSLTPLNPATVPGTGGATPGAAVLTFDPTANFAYLSNDAGAGMGSVALFSVNPTTRQLTYVSNTAITQPNSNPYSPNTVIIDPTGSYLYVNDPGNATIAQFSIDGPSGGNTGALTPLANPTISQIAHSITLATIGGNSYIYTANNNSGNLAQYEINAGTGDLGTELGFISAGAGTPGPKSIVFDPSKSYAYSADNTSGQISQFSVDNTGAFTALPTPTVAAGTAPLYMVTTTEHN